MYKDQYDISKYLDQEEHIVWLEEGAAELPYVRQSIDLFARRRCGRMSFKGHEGRLVGYAELKSDAAHCGLDGKFARRYFWLKDHDRDRQPEGCYKTGAPSEAIDPQTLAPGIEGNVTERAWGAPLPPAHSKR